MKKEPKESFVIVRVSKREKAEIVKKSEESKESITKVVRRMMGFND